MPTAIVEIENMVDTGLLVLTCRSLPRLSGLLSQAASSVRQRLYVRVESGDLDSLVPRLYLESSLLCPHLDVRVLLADKIPSHQKLIGEDAPGTMSVPQKKYSEVVMGGTFDLMHNGHKTLLSKAILLGRKQLYCGVTDVAMIQKKNLWELISPVQERMADVDEFVYDVSEGLECITFPLDDPYGKSITVPTLEAIIVSDETLKGGEAVNRRRQENGLSTLVIEKISLLEAEDKVLNETKISSSTKRREALGTLLRAPFRSRDPSGPYVIGLAGGIASGKSNIAKYLSKNPDFEVIDCDKLAHEAYAPGSELCKKIGEKYEGVVDESGAVDRKKLGAIIFSNPERRLELNGIVWPVLMEQVRGMIRESKKEFVVVEAAALIEAGWHRQMNELWTVFVPRDEAVRRVIERDGASSEQAEARLNAQLTNKERVDESNVVFCSLWEYEETRAQVDRAMGQVRERAAR